ncbi:MAG: DNA recombination protein RmuC [Gemmatimonadota bacterium]|nr:DNA recombination protein RmuC [Gemmatimonadota bacterium]
MTGVQWVPVLAGCAVAVFGAVALLQWRRADSWRDRAARLEAELQASRDSNDTTESILETVETRFRDAFRSLSADALSENSDTFLRLARTSFDGFREATATDLERRRAAVDDLVRPLTEGLGRIDRHLTEAEKERGSAHAALTGQIDGLFRTQQALQTETVGLRRALSAPSIRGRWGEVQLRRVVEMSGMAEHCDFTTQDSSSDEEGRVLRPDLVVHLPGGHSIVVDSKAPLAAYLKAMDAPGEAEREVHLRAHAQSVRDHLKALGGKAYWERVQPGPEFVVMFLPGEAILGAALGKDPDLLEYGVDHKVIPASPATLIALLRSVAFGWRQERAAESARAIAELGRELHGRIGTLAAHFTDMGRALGKTVDTYNRAVGSFEARVLPGARRFHELGAVDCAEVDSPPPLDRVPRSLRDPADPAGPERISEGEPENTEMKP